jgi:hypothetical protein
MNLMKNVGRGEKGSPTKLMRDASKITGNRFLHSAPVGEGKFPNIGKCLMKYPRDGVKNFD